MSNLSSLKLVAAKPRKGENPSVTLRHKGASDFRPIETSRRVSDGHHSGVDFAFI